MLLRLLLALLLPAQSWAAVAPRVIEVAKALSAPPLAPRLAVAPELQHKTTLLLQRAGLPQPPKAQAGPALEAAARLLADVGTDELARMPAEQAQAVVGRIFEEISGQGLLSDPAPVRGFSSTPRSLRPSRGGPATMSLVEVLDSPGNASALLQQLAPGARGARRWAKEARRRLLSPPGTRVRRLPAALERALADLPLITAEGIVRTRIFRPSPAKLPEVADVVVIGAGPAGLATALHTTHAGLKTVVFEAGYLAQSFSDGAMKSVYRMRTPAPRNSLAQAPFSPQALVESDGMLAQLERYRARGQLADSQRDRRTRRPVLGGARQGLEGADPAVPSARNELMQHFSDVGAAIERRGGFVVEKTPVQSVFKREDGLWEIRAGGHRQLARKLAMAQGQVGSEGQFAAVPGDLQQLGWPVLRDRRDLPAKPERRVVIHDSLLGDPSVERLLDLQGDGTVMVIGSGESAVKAAMHVLRVSPRARVSLFVQSDLRPAQLQIPTAHAAPEAIAKAMSDPAYAEQTLREWQEFGAPVTPGTLADLELMKQAGRLEIFPLGKKCVLEETVKLRGNLVYTTDPEIAARMKARGLGRPGARGEWLITTIDGPIVSAVGYSRLALRRDPLTRQLLEAGRLEVKGGEGKAVANEFVLSKDLMTSGLDRDLYLVGAQNFAFSADSALPGAVARAAETAKHLKESLKAPKPAKPQAKKGRWWLWGGGAGFGPAVVELLSQGAYWVANVLSFIFIIPQIHKVVRNRSADVALGTMLIGVVSAALCAVNFAYDDKPLMVYRNVAQVLGFGSVIGLMAWFGSRGKGPQSKWRAVAVTTAIVAAGTAAMFMIGPALLAALPGAAFMKPLVIAFQVATGLGYAYLLVPQLLKLHKDQAARDASALMTAGFLGTRTIGIWAFGTLMSIVGAAHLGALTLYPLLYGAAAYWVMTTLARKQWSKWATFGALSGFFVASVLLGYGAFSALIPEDSGQRFLMYLFYLTHNVTAFMASIVTLATFKKYAKM